MKKRRPLGERPTARELEKVGAATLAYKYAVPVAQIIEWRKEARERSGADQTTKDLKRVEHIRESLGDMQRRGLTARDLEPDYPDRDLLERLLAEDPGPSRDERDRQNGYTKLGGDQVAMTRSPLAPRIYRVYPDLPESIIVYLPLVCAIGIGLTVVLLIASGVWK